VKSRRIPTCLPLSFLNRGATREVAVGQAAKARRASWRAHYRHVLDLIFEEHAAQEIIVLPDEAVRLMEEMTERLFKDILRTAPDSDASPSMSVVRFDYDAYRREAHHYAVDRFYKTYFPRKRGAPPLPDSYLDPILQLRFMGLNYAAIANRLGMDKETVRKRLPVAEKRWREVVAGLERFKQQTPISDTARSRPKAAKESTHRKQSKLQKR
jgi:hypothetical protein